LRQDAAERVVERHGLGGQCNRFRKHALQGVCDRHQRHAKFSLRMILTENLLPLFGIMR
jgi:hypothetical protein